MNLFPLLCLPIALGAYEVRIDQPERWYDAATSHHMKHAEGGMVIGAAAYGLASLGTDSQAWRYADAVLAGAVIGIGYEVVHAEGSTYADPVDACWVVAGSLIGATLADLTGQAVTVALRKDGASATIAFRF